MKKFSEIPQFTQTAAYSHNVDWRSLEHNIEDYISTYGLQMNPDFQRGHVWTEAQQVAYVEFALRGGKSGKDILFNHTGWMKSFEGEFVLVDGLQRITAVLRFLHNEIPAFGRKLSEWEGKLSWDIGFVFHVNDLPNRAAVLRWYLELNTGGARTGAGNRDIGGEGVQQSILKLLEGRKIFVPVNVTQHWNKHDFVEIDTSNILFICAGTFTDAREETPASGLGFGADVTENRKPARRITHDKLVEAGMIAELLGRLPVVVQLDHLSPEDLARILVEPPDSLVKEYKKILEIQGVSLDFTQEAILEVAEFAGKRKVGARGLRALLEEVLQDTMFDAPEMETKTVMITPEMVTERLKNFDSGMSEE
jgi:hypothetical protein